MNTFPLENIQSAAQSTDSWPKVCVSHVGIIKAMIMAKQPIAADEIANISGISPQSIRHDIPLLYGVVAKHAPGWEMVRDRLQKRKATNRFVYSLERAKR